jgi:hypothetical protein
MAQELSGKGEFCLSPQLYFDLQTTITATTISMYLYDSTNATLGLIDISTSKAPLRCECASTVVARRTCMISRQGRIRCRIHISVTFDGCSGRQRTCASCSAVAAMLHSRCTLYSFICRMSIGTHPHQSQPHTHRTLTNAARLHPPCLHSPETHKSRVITQGHCRRRALWLTNTASHTHTCNAVHFAPRCAYAMSLRSAWRRWRAGSPCRCPPTAWRRARTAAAAWC